jgi:hypothetical protein
MKIRTGFVSNSSTSSYVIIGCNCSDMKDDKIMAIVYKLLNIETKNKEELTSEQKKQYIINVWNTTHYIGNKPIEYYKWKCGEFSYEQFSELYSETVVDDDNYNDCDIYELLDGSGWKYECDNGIIGYEISHICSDSSIESQDLDFDNLQKQTKKLESITGKKAKIYSYVTGG